jgi:uridine kinase
MDEKLFEVILWHSKAYPHMKPADYVKLLYQNEFGCSHYITNPERSLSQLREEFGSLPVPEEEACRRPRMELIGNGLCRIFLEPGSQTEEFLPLLNLMCIATAHTHMGNRMRLMRKLESLSQMAAKGLLCVGREEMDAFLERYVASKGGPVGHSGSYKREYAPHYWVVKASYYFYLPVLRAAMERIGSHSGRRPEIFALDGRCGSGKSFLANVLKEIFGCSVFHMDDFYLPPERRGKEWMSQPGGNIDRGRFLKEVLEPLSNGETIQYRPYSCVQRTMLPQEEFQPGRLAVIEGSYSLHPDFCSYYDYRVFLTCLSNVQQRRIFLRSDGNRLHDFLERWIPAEERYFEAMKIGKICDLTLDTSGFENYE